MTNPKVGTNSLTSVLTVRCVRPLEWSYDIRARLNKVLTCDLTCQFLSWGGVLVLILSYRRTFSENPKIYFQFSFQVEKIYIVCGNLGLGLTYFGGDVCEEEASGM